MLTTLLADIRPAPERLYVFHYHQWREAIIPQAWFADLSVEELKAAERLTDSTIYLKQRIIRRQTLAACCGVKPGAIAYDVSQDKPRLYNNTSISDFSVTHTADDLLVAVVFSQYCGVDYERQRPLLYKKAIAARFFTTNERHVWRERQYDPAYFFYIWTLKEAAVKCMGSGMFADAKYYDFTTTEVLYKQRATQNRWITECQENGYFSLVFTGLQTQLHYRTMSITANQSAERIIQLDRVISLDLGDK